MPALRKPRAIRTETLGDERVNYTPRKQAEGIQTIGEPNQLNVSRKTEPKMTVGSTCCSFDALQSTSWIRLPSRLFKG